MTWRRKSDEALTRLDIASTGSCHHDSTFIDFCGLRRRFKLVDHFQRSKYKRYQIRNCLNSSNSPGDNMASFEMNDLKKTGLGLTGFGVFFTFLGVIFVFDKGLIAMGNILFLAGVTLTIGINPAIQFFTKRRNFKGTISFGLGFLLVVFGWPIFGLLLESYGFLVLFRGYLYWAGFCSNHTSDRYIALLSIYFPFKLYQLLDRYRGRRVPV